MKRSIVCLVMALLLAAATAAQAEVKAGAYTVSPLIGGYLFEGNQDLKNAPLFGLRGGYHVTKNLGLEGFFHHVPSENEALAGKPSVDLFAFGIEGLYHFMPESRLVPFVAVGVGGTRYSQAGGKNRDRFTMDYGAGLKYSLSESLGLRADVRHVVLPLHDRYNEFLYTVGLEFTFGGPAKPKPVPVAAPMPVPPPAPVVPRDTDGDGVPDDLDKCPGTSAGVKVDRDGCPLDSDRDGVYDYLDKCPGTPAGVKVDKDGCPLDSDRDGVYDYLDKCPGTPVGVKVDRDGCPLDSDRDGVYDYLDKCPGTPAGVKVDRDGCPLDSDRDGVYDHMDKCPGTPAGVKVDRDGCPLDSDRDGVYDYLDKCPGTPAGVKVDRDGCPLDSDGDGVYDYLDKCPGTPAGVKVDKDGCPPPVVQKAPPAAPKLIETAIVEKGRVTLTVQFDFDKSIIKKEYHDEIAELAEVMKKYPSLRITLEGHTDNIGGAAYNAELSLRRADAVKDYLVTKFGIAAARLDVKGYGEERPVDTNATREGRQKNRRVEAAADYIIKK